LILRQPVSGREAVSDRDDDRLAWIGLSSGKTEHEKQGCGEKAQAGNVEVHLFDLFDPI